MAEAPDDADEEKPPRPGDKEAWSNIQILLRDLIIFRAPLKDIETVLRCGGEVNGPIVKGLRALHYAVYDDNVDCAALLIEKGADVNLPDFVEYRPVHIAAKHGSLNCLKLLIEKGAQVDFVNDAEPDSEVKSLGYLTVEPINLALSNNHIECARFLFENGISPNNRYFLGNEISLITLENTECLKLLLEFGADPNSFCRSGTSPLMTACKEQNIDAIELLLENGADINLKGPPRFDEKRALYYAILGGNLEVTRVLLERGAYLRCICAKTHALTFAVSRRKKEFCELLIAHGADVNERNEDGLTPLLAACTARECDQELVELLLEKGADPNIHCEYASFDQPSLTPLFEYFVFHRRPDFQIAQLLLKYGARVSFRQATRNCLIKDPFGFLCHFPKLLRNQGIFDLLLAASEAFSPQAATQSRDLCEEEKAILLSLAVPVRLKHLARVSIRRSTGLVLPERVATLPLPSLLKSYLLFEAY